MICSLVSYAIGMMRLWNYSNSSEKYMLCKYLFCQLIIFELGLHFFNRLSTLNLDTSITRNLWIVTSRRLQNVTLFRKSKTIAKIQKFQNLRNCFRMIFQTTVFNGWFLHGCPIWLKNEIVYVFSKESKQLWWKLFSKNYKIWSK